MVKLGKKKLAELSELSKKKASEYADTDENPNNGAGSSGDDENEAIKEVDTKNETSSKKQRASAVSAKVSTQDESESNESDDLPLNGSKGSSSAGGGGGGGPPRKKQKKMPKSKGKASSSTSSSAAGKNDNKKSSKSDDDDDDDNNDNNDNTDEDEEAEGEEGEYEVESIIGHKSKRGESFFLVHWKGYGKESDTWEPEADLNCDDLIKEYRKKGGAKKSTSTSAAKKSPTGGKGTRGRKPVKKVEADPEKEWAVERILDFVDDDEHGGLYRIRWKGFGAKEDTWEPESNLSCQGLIEKFKKGLDANVDSKALRYAPQKVKRLVNETAPRSNLHNRIERSSKRAATKNRVFYGEE